MHVIVERRGHRAQSVGVINAFLHGLDHFFVIALVGGRFRELAPVGDRDTAPLLDERGESGARFLSAPARARRVQVCHASGIHQHQLRLFVQALAHLGIVLYSNQLS